MKRLLLAVAVLLSGTMALAQGGVEKALLDLEQQWVKAQLSGNAQALEPILAAVFVSLQSDGTVQTKAVYVGNTAKTKWQASAARGPRSSSAAGSLASEPGASVPQVANDREMRSRQSTRAATAWFRSSAELRRLARGQLRRDQARSVDSDGNPS